MLSHAARTAYAGLLRSANPPPLTSEPLKGRDLGGIGLALKRWSLSFGPVFGTSWQLKYLALTHERILEHGARLCQDHVRMLTGLDPR